MSGNIRQRLAGPYRKNRIDRFAPYVLVAAFSAAIWTTMDNDSFYMISEGRRILSDLAVPTEHAWSYYGRIGTVLQQWLYCAAMALCARVPSNMGLLAFMLAQAMAVFHMVKKKIMARTDDGFLGGLAAMAACAACAPVYFYSLRPENITLILLLSEISALDRYRRTGKPGWLVTLPLLVALEMNLHGSMWPFHLCVWLAYAVPPVGPLKSKMRDASLRRDIKFWAAGAAMLPATLLNPYGADMPLYMFRSMEIFKHVVIGEQESPELLSPPAIFAVLCTAAIVLIMFRTKNRKPESHMAWMVLGFSALAMLNYHLAMFMPIALCMLACCAFDAFAELSPARSADTMPEWLRLPLWAGCLAVLAAACLVRLPAMGQFDKGDGYAAAVAYVARNQEPGEAVLNHFDVGSQLEYYGVDNILTDSRPELMLESVNGTYDIWKDYAWMDTGEWNDEKKDEYGSVQGYLDAHNIQYIVERRKNPAYQFLMGWLERDGNWERAEISEKCLYDVWVRKHR